MKKGTCRLGSVSCFKRTGHHSNCLPNPLYYIPDQSGLNRSLSLGANAIYFVLEVVFEYSGVANGTANLIRPDQISRVAIVLYHKIVAKYMSV